MKHNVSFAGQQVRLDFPDELEQTVDFLFGRLPTGPDSGRAQRITIKAGSQSGFDMLREGALLAQGLPRRELANPLMGEVIHALIENQSEGLSLHAAAVSSGDRAVWLPGRSGSGKSTLTAWLLSRGFDYLGDELVHAHLKNNGFESFLRPLNIKNSALAAVEELLDIEQTHPRMLRSSSATMIPHTEFSAASGRDNTGLSLIIFPEFSAESALGLEPLSPARAALLLMNSYVNARNLENHGFPEIAALVKKVPAFKLIYGHFDQLDGTLDEIIRLILEHGASGSELSRWLKIIDRQAQYRPPPITTATPAPAPIPQASPAGTRKKLTIGMATYDDYDGVYFSVQAIRLYHPEVLDETEILVIDNHPDGPCAEALKNLDKWVKHYRYIPNQQLNGTAVRDYVFREANADYVMCIDSHVMIQAGAIRKLIDYFDEHPRCSDLLQGPMLRDDASSVETHFKPEWRGGMYGVWETDPRGEDPHGEPFEIPMQGLALFACRKSAWPGFNPAFRGFGGEEGYIHEKFRAAGHKALCLPFLRWLHRFARPMGVPYVNVWEDRIRNYLIGFTELGLNTVPVEQHFSELLNPEVVDRTKQELALDEPGPFDFFDAIYCINLDQASQRWSQMLERFGTLGIVHRIQRFSAIETPDNHHIGCALSHRAIIDQAARRGFRNVLVFEDDAIFHRDTLSNLEASLNELEGEEWSWLYLGGVEWRKPTPVPGKVHLQKPQRMTCTHAIAYNREYFRTLLDELPETREAMQSWVDKHLAIDQYLARRPESAYATRPTLVIQTNHSRVAGAAPDEEFLP